MMADKFLTNRTHALDVHIREMLWLCSVTAWSVLRTTQRDLAVLILKDGSKYKVASWGIPKSLHILLTIFIR